MPESASDPAEAPPPAPPGRPPVTVLLALHNGGRYLRAQLDSLSAQTLRPLRVIARDDGSTDDSREIFARWAAETPGIDAVLIAGPRIGAAAGFDALVGAAPADGGLVAMSDQDDVWLPGKLSRAAAALAGMDGVPALYGAATWVCDETLDRRRPAHRPRARLGLSHALVQNFAGGNTMVMNAAALALAQAALRRGARFPVHDWGLYQLVAAAGGRILYDPEPVVLYRQHGRNAIGANLGARAAWRRARAMLGGRYGEWNRANLAALAAAGDLLTPEAREAVIAFAEARRAPLPRRLAMLRRLGLHRGSLLGNAGLWVSALIARL